VKSPEGEPLLWLPSVDEATPDDATALEFEIGRVWEASEGCIGRTTAVELCFVVPFHFLSRTCMGMMARGDDHQDLSDHRKDSADPIDFLTKRVSFYVPSIILKSRETGAMPIPRSLPA
jgi:hypothetical protein